MLSFFLLGFLAVSCAHEACHESLTIYNFSKNHKKENNGASASAKDKDKQSNSTNSNGLINDVKYVLQLPLLWSLELVVIYVLVSWFNPNWVSVPLHAYFVIVGM